MARWCAFSWAAVNATATSGGPVLTVGSPVKGTKMPLIPRRDISPEKTAGFTGLIRRGAGIAG